jgi:hypothetical protein
MLSEHGVGNETHESTRNIRGADVRLLRAYCRHAGHPPSKLRSAAGLLSRSALLASKEAIDRMLPTRPVNNQQTAVSDRISVPRPSPRARSLRSDLW